MPTSEVKPRIKRIGFCKRVMVEIEPETYLRLQKLSKATGLQHKALVKIAVDYWGAKHEKAAKNAAS